MAVVTDCGPIYDGVRSPEFWIHWLIQNLAVSRSIKVLVIQALCAKYSSWPNLSHPPPKHGNPNAEHASFASYLCRCK